MMTDINMRCLFVDASFKPNASAFVGFPASAGLVEHAALVALQ